MPASLYVDVHRRRGQAENHIKSFKTHLAADRTSCTKASTNQLRLFLHAGAYWLMWGLRESMPKRSMWRVGQTRRPAQGLSRRRHRPRPFQALLRDARRRQARGSCNAHHLRELKALIDIDKEQWAGQMRDLLLAWPRTGNASTATALRSCAGLPSA